MGNLELSANLTIVPLMSFVPGREKTIMDKILQDLVNGDANTKFVLQIMSIRSQDIERKHILLSFKGHNSLEILKKKISGYNSKQDPVNVDVPAIWSDFVNSFSRY